MTFLGKSAIADFYERGRMIKEVGVAVANIVIWIPKAIIHKDESCKTK
jgi:hypothetical protein